MENIKVIYGDIKYIDSFYEALSFVAEEQIYIEMIKAPPKEDIYKIQSELINKNGPVYYALKNEVVVGWCDVSPFKNPRLSHRGSLGMALLPKYRGIGLGSKLLSKVIDKTIDYGLEKVELEVYSTNLPAINLYKKFGFEQQGLIKRYRKLNNTYYDALSMAKFLC